MKKNKGGKQFKTNSKLLRGFLTEREVELLHRQIRINSIAMDRYIQTIDLLANKEKCPKDANTLMYLRSQLSIAIAENDTFRKVLWRHAQCVESQLSSDSDLDAASFLVGRINSRRKALMAQMAMTRRSS
ncbi:MAG: hypothetical protein A3C35_04970 [Omnitrophica bacterium RIFCSPHIGHO2_02_FULL_46_11]|nr:MAG: hypothetical protein A3C35_04970 [Omnitrophica bacterium RIFCSPHIGHO2_02_FULL_46_11]OGW87787.1 MAG: hypothetical protein A3A81_01660 [Omnitrophica bacterium RIFCSPLOWO2_01_FULL_45_10b]